MRLALLSKEFVFVWAQVDGCGAYSYKGIFVEIYILTLIPFDSIKIEKADAP